jgi:hypothetical protein
MRMYLAVYLVTMLILLLSFGKLGSEGIIEAADHRRGVAAREYRGGLHHLLMRT